MVDREDLDRTGSPRRGRPGYDQATVLERAIDLFNRQGYDATSMADLASELGLSKSAIYHHVPGKEHLLAAALDEALGELEAAVDAATSSSARPATDRLRDLVRTSVSILVGHLSAVTLLLRVHGNSEVELAALGRRRDIDDRLATLVRQAAAEGGVRRDVAPELISRLLFGMVNSLTEWYNAGGPLDADALARAIEAVAFEGVGTSLTSDRGHPGRS